MKKIISFALSIMMIATMSVSAFAETALTESPVTNKGTGDYTIGVNGTYNAGSGAADEVISVDISWEGMEFTFTAGDITYDPTTHENKQGNGEWSNANENGKGSVTVRNHSNVEIDATFKFTAATNLTVTGCFFTKVENESGVGDPSYFPISGEADQKLHLESALGKTRADEDSTKDQTPTDTIYFAITDGSITAENNGKSLGTITVTIAKAATTSEAGE